MKKTYHKEGGEWHRGLMPRTVLVFVSDDSELSVEENEIHYVNHLIPTLDWDGGKLGVRLKLTPENVEALHDEFLEAFNRSKEIKGKSNLNLSDLNPPLVKAKKTKQR